MEVEDLCTTATRPGELSYTVRWTFANALIVATMYQRDLALRAVRTSFLSAVIPLLAGRISHSFRYSLEPGSSLPRDSRDDRWITQAHSTRVDTINWVGFIERTRITWWIKYWYTKSPKEGLPDWSILISRRVSSFGPAYALGQSSFSKRLKEKILNFLHEVEKIISVISVQI